MDVIGPPRHYGLALWPRVICLFKPIPEHFTAMGLQYELVWGFLLVEVTGFFFLILPIPERWKVKVIQGLRTPHNIPYILRILYIFIFILFLGTMWSLILQLVDSTTRSLQLRLQRGGDARLYEQMTLKLFYAQRNMYLTGFTLFLGLYSCLLVLIVGFFTR
jgi:B-cell receptor-associated protein 31